MNPCICKGQYRGLSNRQRAGTLALIVLDRLERKWQNETVSSALLFFDLPSGPMTDGYCPVAADAVEGRVGASGSAESDSARRRWFRRGRETAAGAYATAYDRFKRETSPKFKTC